MGIYKTYFSKNNTIIKGSEVNTANNPISELAFGDRVTRFLFYVDLTDLKNKVVNKEIVITPETKHIIRLKSTVEFSLNQYLNTSNQIEIDSTHRPTSFDLELHPVTQTWDEGNGYDFSLNITRRTEDLDYVRTPSNWNNATSTTVWQTPGAVSTGSTAVATQHFDKGNEDLEMDITTYVNDLLTNTGNTYQGFCLKYADAHENVGPGVEYVTGFFTKYTQSYFEPFLETVFDDVIKDDRQKFFLNKTNRLFLYMNVGGKLTNADELPTCTIGTTGQTVQQHSKGVYFVEVDASATDFISYKKYYDVWGNLKVGGKTLDDVTMNFIPKDENEYYQLSDDFEVPVRHGISISGVRQEEKVTRGEKRRVNVLVRKPYTVNQTDVIDDILYRVYVKVGTSQHTVIDWSVVSRTNLHNFFTLDTSWMIPNKYFVDVMVKQNGETILYNDIVSFIIASRRNM